MELDPIITWLCLDSVVSETGVEEQERGGRVSVGKGKMSEAVGMEVPAASRKVIRGACTLEEAKTCGRAERLN
jgi:hypothetical protein